MKKRLLLLLCLLVTAGSAAWAEIAHGDCKNGSWVIDNSGKLTVNINGDMADYGEGKAPWYQYADRITAIHIGSACTNIGRNGFYGLSQVESVTGGENVEACAMYSFQKCGYYNDNGIPSIYFPKCDYVGECAFSGCCAQAISLPLVETWKVCAIVGDFDAFGDFVQNNYAWGSSSCNYVDLGSKTKKLRPGSLVGPNYVFCQSPTPPEWERLYDKSEVDYALYWVGQIFSLGHAGSYEREYEYPFGDNPDVKVIVPQEYLQTYIDYYPTKHPEVSEGYMCAYYTGDHGKSQSNYPTKSTGKLVAGAPIYENGQFIGGWYVVGSGAFKQLYVFFSNGMPSYEGRTAPWASAGNVERMHLYVSDGKIPAGAFKNGNGLNDALYLYLDSYDPLNIGESAFAGNTHLSFVMLDTYASDNSQKVTIGNSAFKGCTKMRCCDMGVISLGVSAFEGCPSLSNVGTYGLKLNLQDIPERAFYGVKMIDRMDFSKIRTIGKQAFGGGSGLDEVNLSNCKSVGQEAFADATLGKINFGPSTFACTFGSKCFAGCTRLYDVFVSSILDCDMSSDIFNGVTLSNVTLHCKPELYGQCYEDDGIFGKMKVDRDFTFPVEGSVVGGTAGSTWSISSAGTLRINCWSMPNYNTNREQPWYQYREYIKDIVLDNCQIIGKNAFSEMPYLRNVSIPRDCKEIRDEAFKNCPELENIYITRVETLGSYVFEGCTNLKTIELGMHLATVGDYVFKNCHSLVDIENLNSTPAATTKYSFADIKSGAYNLKGGPRKANDEGQSTINLNIPDAYVVNYMTDPNWSQFHISYADNRGTWVKAGKFGDGMWVLYDDGTMVISADKGPANDTNPIHHGFMTSGTDHSNDAVTLTKRIEFVGNMTELDAYFSEYFVNLETVKLSPSIKKILDGALSDCPKLKNINLGNIESIGKYAFSGTAFDILDLTNVKKIDRGAFSPCPNLAAVTLGSTCEVGPAVFRGCNNLTLVDLGGANLDKAENCFGSCKGLKVVAYNGTRLTWQIFSNCTALEKVKLGGRLESIEWSAFEGCTALDTIVVDRPTPPSLPKGEKQVWLGDVDYRMEDAWAFDGLTLKNIHLVVAPDYIPAYKKANIWKDMTIEGDTEAVEPELPAGGSLGSNGTWFLDTDGTLIVDVSGDIPATDSQGKPWCETFNAYIGLIKTVTFTDNVTSIPDNFFGGTYFADASAGVETVTLGRFLKSVGANSLSFSGIKDVYVYSENLLEMQSNTFDLDAAAKNNATLHILKTSDGYYYAANPATTRFHVVADLDANEMLKCGTLDTKGYWTFADGVLTVNYNGAMPTITKAETDPDKAFRYKWTSFLAQIEEVVVTGTDVEVQPYFLYYEGNGTSDGQHPDDHIKTVTLGDGVKSLGRGSLSLYELKRVNCYGVNAPTLPVPNKAFWEKRITANLAFLWTVPNASTDYALINSEWAKFNHSAHKLNIFDMPTQEIQADFETGKLNQVAFFSDSQYPWDITNEDAESGRYSMKSGNKGISSSSSSISAMYLYNTDGYIYFTAKCMGEGQGSGWDKCLFYIDGEQQFSYGALGNYWSNYSFPVSAGMHTFKWEYTKDSSVDAEGDAFYVDNIYFLQEGKDDDLITGVEDIEDIEDSKDFKDSWFDLSGRKLTGKPAAPGLYIRNGRKVVIK